MHVLDTINFGHSEGSVSVTHRGGYTKVVENKLVVPGMRGGGIEDFQSSFTQQ